MDLLDRDAFAQHRRGAARRAPSDPAPLKVVGCGRVIPDHDLRVVDAAGLELPDRSEGQLQFRGPSATTGYYRNPEATKGLFARRMGEHRRPRLPLRRHALHHRPREGHHHPRRPQHQPLRARGGGRRPARHPPRLRRGVRLAWTARAAPSAWWCWPRRARRDAARHEELKQQHQRARDEPDRRAGRRHRARAAAHGAEDLQRQDPPRRGARVLRARPGRGEGRRRCGCSSCASALAGVAPQMRRGWRVARGIAVRAARLARLRPLFDVVFVFAALVAPGRPTWSMARRAARALFFRLCAHPAGGARAGEPAAGARSCSPPTTRATSTARC